MSTPQQPETSHPPLAHEVQETADSGDRQQHSTSRSNDKDTKSLTQQQQPRQQEEAQTDSPVPPLVVDAGHSTSSPTESEDSSDTSSLGDDQSDNSTTSDTAWISTGDPSSSFEASSSLTHPQEEGVLFLKSLRVVAKVLSLVFRAFETIMNAAITIFGLGVGVGLILGDSLRSPTVTHGGTSAAFSSSDGNTTAAAAAASTVSVVVRPATPSCRATIRRTHVSRIQEAPTMSLSSNGNTHQLPAQ